MSSDPAHIDLVAGSKRALIITLTNGVTGAILTKIPHPMAQNVKDVEATGTKVKWIITGTPPGISLTDPREIAPALKLATKKRKSKQSASENFGHSHTRLLREIEHRTVR